MVSSLISSRVISFVSCAAAGVEIRPHVIDIADCEPPRRAAKRGLGPRYATHTRRQVDSLYTKPSRKFLYEHGHEHRVGRSAAARDTKESFRAQAA